MDVSLLEPVLADIGEFSRVVWPDKALRGYQLAPARAIVRAALNLTGETLVIVFSRQSGKDEMLAQTFAYLLILTQFEGGSIVVAQPSMIPQGRISMQRLVDRLGEAGALAEGFETEDGEIVRLGRASVRYSSAGPGSQARGATADRLLVANEAQDIDPDRWDAVFDPMGASTNSSSVFSGTVWTTETLLARAMIAAEAAGTLYRADWKRVAAEVGPYGARVRARIAELGEEHPFIRTEYRLLPLEGGGTFLDAGKLAQMHGTHARIRAAAPGRTYALLVDVAGGSETPAAPGVIHHGAGGRDASVLTVVEVVRPAGEGLPVYRTVDRRVWQGMQHVALSAEIADLYRRVWHAEYLVVDATGIGHGLAAMLGNALGPDVVLPFVFSSSSKSDLGWRFLGLVGAGRFQEYADDGQPDTREFWEQAGECTYAVRPGPNRLMSWSVPEKEGHDDYLLSAALVGMLDDLDWRSRIARGR
jgi:hypothetical protein